MVTCLLKCYDQCLGVCDKPLLNAWTMVMVFENGIFRVSMPASNSVMTREMSCPDTAHSIGEDTLITHTKGPTLHLQLYYSNHSFDFRYNTHITNAIGDDNGITRYTRCSVFQKLLIYALCVIRVRRSARNAVLLTRMTLNLTFKTSC